MSVPAPAPDPLLLQLRLEAQELLRAQHVGPEWQCDVTRESDVAYWYSVHSAATLCTTVRDQTRGRKVRVALLCWVDAHTSDLLPVIEALAGAFGLYVDAYVLCVGPTPAAALASAALQPRVPLSVRDRVTYWYWARPASQPPHLVDWFCVAVHGADAVVTPEAWPTRHVVTLRRRWLPPLLPAAAPPAVDGAARDTGDGRARAS